MIGLSQKKTCQVQFQKQNYLRHLHRLIKLKEGVSSQQLKRSDQERKLAETINRVRKNHQYSRHYKWKQMKLLQDNSNEKDFSKVKSVVKQQIQKPTLDIVPRHRKDTASIYKQNLKIFQRICKTKPCLNLSRYDTPPKAKQSSIVQNNGFSILYETSRLNQKKKKIIKLKLGNSKKYIKKILQIDNELLYQVLRDRQNVYIIQFCIGKLKSRTQNLQLSNTELAQIHLKIPKKGFQASLITGKVIKLVSSMYDKEMIKANFTVVQEQCEQAKKCKNIRMKMQLNNNKMPYFQTVAKVNQLNTNGKNQAEIMSKTAFIR